VVHCSTLVKTERSITLRRNILVFVALAVIIAVALMGCGKGGAIAELNGKKISYEDYAKYMIRTNPDSATGMLVQMMDNQLMMDLAKEKGVPVTDKQVNQQIEFFKKKLDLDWQLKDGGLTLDELKEQIKPDQARTNLALKEFKSDITEDDIKKAYEASKQVPERVLVELVAFRTKADVDAAEKKLSDGDSLETVVKEANSKILHRAISKAAADTPPGLAQAAFETEKGKISKPFSISLGSMMGSEQWMILRAGEKLGTETVPYDLAKPLIEGQLAIGKARQDTKFEDMIKEARKKAKITVLNPSLSAAAKEFNK
jgi:hypothetical protein